MMDLQEARFAAARPLAAVPVPRQQLTPRPRGIVERLTPSLPSTCASQSAGPAIVGPAGGLPFAGLSTWTLGEPIHFLQPSRI